MFFFKKKTGKEFSLNKTVTALRDIIKSSKESDMSTITMTSKLHQSQLALLLKS